MGFWRLMGRNVCTYKRKEFRRSVNIRNKSRVTLVIYLKFCCGMRLEKMVRGQSPSIAKEIGFTSEARVSVTVRGRQG